MNLRNHPLATFSKVNIWIDAAPLGSTGANCLSFPESIASDYSVLDHWNVPCWLPEFLTAASFITANALVIAKHWFCCRLSQLYSPLLCLSKTHSICCYCYPHLFFLHFDAVIYFKFSVFQLNITAELKVQGPGSECVTVSKYCNFVLIVIIVIIILATNWEVVGKQLNLAYRTV